MTRVQLQLLAINLVLTVGFGARFIARSNHEFTIYIGVIIFFVALIGATRHAINYSTGALVGLTVWSALHMAGGGLSIGDGRLYDCILIPLSRTWPIFRYDQLVHIWGFGAATLALYDVLKSTAIDLKNHPIATGLVLVLAGLGAGALNEIVEFAVATALPASGVGGYINTSLDLCADLLGSLLALLYIRYSDHENVG